MTPVAEASSGPEADGPVRLAALGPFFALHTHDGGRPASPPWRSMRELTDRPDTLRERVDRVRSHLAASGAPRTEDVERRVAASVTHLGLTARVVSPALALAALEGVTTPPRLDDLRWQPVLGGAFPLSAARGWLRAAEVRRPTTARRGPPASPATETALPDWREWATGLIDDPVRRLLRATEEFSLSPRVLWGNVASAVAGAATALGGTAPAHAQARIAECAEALLAHPALRGTSTGTAGSGDFRRRSCCLIWRAAPTGARAVCGDCVLSRGG